MRKGILSIVVMVLGIGAAAAQMPSKVPARRDSVAVQQPNGEQVYLVLHGDERTHFYTTTDGYLVKENCRGYFCYAKQTACGNVKASSRVARNIAQRSCCDNRYLKRIRENQKLYLF